MPNTKHFNDIKSILHLKDEEQLLFKLEQAYRAGFNIGEVDENGNNIIHLAVIKGESNKVLKVILEYCKKYDNDLSGVLSAMNNELNTPLHLAVIEVLNKKNKGSEIFDFDIEKIKLLIENKACIYYQNENINQNLLIQYYNKEDSLINSFTKCTNINFKTPLDLAIEAGTINVKDGANINLAQAIIEWKLLVDKYAIKPDRLYNKKLSKLSKFWDNKVKKEYRDDFEITYNDYLHSKENHAEALLYKIMINVDVFCSYYINNDEVLENLSHLRVKGRTLLHYLVKHQKFYKELASKLIEKNPFILDATYSLSTTCLEKSVDLKSDLHSAEPEKYNESASNFKNSNFIDPLMLSLNLWKKTDEHDQEYANKQKLFAGFLIVKIIERGGSKPSILENGDYEEFSEYWDNIQQIYDHIKTKNTDLLGKLYDNLKEKEQYIPKDIEEGVLNQPNRDGEQNQQFFPPEEINAIRRQKKCKAVSFGIVGGGLSLIGSAFAVFTLLLLTNHKFADNILDKVKNITSLDISNKVGLYIALAVSIVVVLLGIWLSTTNCILSKELKQSNVLNNPELNSITPDQNKGIGASINN